MLTLGDLQSHAESVLLAYVPTLLIYSMTVYLTSSPDSRQSLFASCS